MESCNPVKARSLQIDPLNMCPPIGAMYAAFGVHACLPHSHGASGCCRFQRMHISMHFQKIIRVTSSMLTESAAVFGGRENLEKAVANAFLAYDPEVIAIHTTCLSETIGDDVAGILRTIPVPRGKRVVYASTPGYIGSHLTGYSAMVEGMLRQLAAPPMQKTGRLLLIPGILNPTDVRELDRYADAFFPERTVFPDIRGIMEEKTPRNPGAYLPGGTPVKEIEEASACRCAVTVGREACAGAERALAELGVSTERLDLPIGLLATDRYLAALSQASGKAVPETIRQERRHAVDTIMELFPRLCGKRVALCCDADINLPLAEYLAGIGMKPVYLCTGYAEEDFPQRVGEALHDFSCECEVCREGDRYDLEQYLAAHPVDFLIGTSHCKILAKKFGIPLIRAGFPVTDRALGYLTPIVGYRGCLFLLQKLLDASYEQEEKGLAAEDLPIGEYF